MGGDGTPRDSPTPATEWDLRALVDHWVLDTGHGLEHRARRAELPAELVARDFAAWEGDVDFGGGSPMPAEAVAGMNLAELVLHGWDVDAATGGTIEVADGTARTVLALVEQYAEMYREYAGFGDALPLDDRCGVVVAFGDDRESGRNVGDNGPLEWLGFPCLGRSTRTPATTRREPTVEVLGRLWARVTTPVDDLPVEWLLVAAAAALVVVAAPALWRPARGVVTIAHEGAHGLVALAAGRRLSGIRLHSDTSGLTVSAGRPTGAGMVATCAAGYTGPALFGLGSAALLAAGHAVGLLWALLALLALLLVQIRNWYGLWSVLVTGAAVFAATWWLPPRGQAVFAAALTWFMLLAAPKAVVELQRTRRRRGARDSDADQLARLTGLPPLVWVGVLLVVDLGCLALGAWLLLT